MAYTTKQGDTWDIISYRVYGDEGNLSALIAANPQHAAVTIFSGGVELQTPVVQATATVQGLPPWKRNAGVD